MEKQTNPLAVFNDDKILVALFSRTVTLTTAGKVICTVSALNGNAFHCHSGGRGV
jgi:hypothetical protein